jgi:ADP-ribose pyrophosphatase YjhB (NUDIX family)
VTTLPTRERSGPTLVDRGFQIAYVCAYRMMRTYWMLRHPATHGALVALFNGGEVLLVRNSYVPYYGLPGGYVRRGETATGAALRELLEEVGLSARAEQLELALDETHEWEGKHDHVQIFALDLESRPSVEVDHREVVEASWWPPERALSLRLFPPVRHMLEKRASIPSL